MTNLEQAVDLIKLPDLLSNVTPDMFYVLGTFNIYITSDGDTWVSAGGNNHSPAYRYRAYHGGSHSPYTHNTLVLLAYAIHLHNKPELIEGAIDTPLGKILASEFDKDLARRVAKLRRVSRVHDDQDEHHVGHLRISFAKNHLSAYTPPKFLGNYNHTTYKKIFKKIFGKLGVKLKRFIFKKDTTLANKIVWNAFRLLALAMHMDDEGRPQPTLLEIRRIP